MQSATGDENTSRPLQPLHSTLLRSQLGFHFSLSELEIALEVSVDEGWPLWLAQQLKLKARYCSKD